MGEFRHMRLADNQMTREDTERQLTEALAGTLALQADNGYPLTVPIGFVYKDGKILFHGANEGQKYELIQKEPKASFCVITKNDIRPEFITSLYESAVVFGTVREIRDDEGRKACLIAILEKYMPEVMEAGIKYMNDTWDSFSCFELEIEHMTGKFGTE